MAQSPSLSELISLVYTPTTPKATREQADQYLAQVAASQEGWKAFAQHLFSTTSLEAVFYCLNIIREVIMHRHV